jgi:hypothetical protein
MAASYLADHVTEYSGLILLASYSTKDLHSTSLKTCTIYGSEDKVLNQNKYHRFLRRIFPRTITRVEIPGGNHGQFGDYGVQKGDGTASISREEQQNQTVQAIVSLCQ